MRRSHLTKNNYDHQHVHNHLTTEYHVQSTTDTWWHSQVIECFAGFTFPCLLCWPRGIPVHPHKDILSIFRVSSHGAAWMVRWVCLKMLAKPHCTQWFLLIIIPFLNGYFIGNINPTFSDKPRWSFGLSGTWLWTSLDLAPVPPGLVQFLGPRLSDPNDVSPAMGDIKWMTNCINPPNLKVYRFIQKLEVYSWGYQLKNPPWRWIFQPFIGDFPAINFHFLGIFQPATAHSLGPGLSPWWFLSTLRTSPWFARAAPPRMATRPWLFVWALSPAGVEGTKKEKHRGIDRCRQM